VKKSLVWKLEIWYRYSLRATILEKGIGHSNSICQPIFKMAAIVIKCLLYQLFKQWSKHNIWY